MASQACQATEFRDPRLLDILAVTQAAKGGFAAARKTAADAIALAKEQPDLLRQLQGRLRLYEKGQTVPARENER